MTSFRYKFGIVPFSMVLFTLAACDSVDPLPSGGNGTQGDVRQSSGDSSAASTPMPAPAATSTAATTPMPTETPTPSRTPQSTSRTPGEPPSPTETSGAHESTDPATPSTAHSLPQEFEGRWTSVGQGDAETSYRFHTDGRYEGVSILLQQRASGKFSFVITSSGFAAVSGKFLTLAPTEGTQVMEDPDVPSRNFNKPLTDLTPDEFLWTFQDGQLILSSQLGTVAYARDQETE